MSRFHDDSTWSIFGMFDLAVCLSLMRFVLRFQPKINYNRLGTYFNHYFSIGHGQCGIGVGFGSNVMPACSASCWNLLMCKHDRLSAKTFFCTDVCAKETHVVVKAG